MHSPIRGSGYESFLVTTFSSRYSTQKRRVPSFLGTSTTGKPRSDDVGSMTSASSCRLTSAVSASRAVCPARRGAKRTGRAPALRSMRCWVALMTPSACPVHIALCWSSMRRIRVCSAGSTSGRSTSSTCRGDAGGAATATAPPSPGSRGRARIAGPLPVAVAGSGLRPDAGSSRVLETAATTPSAAVADVKAGAGGAPGGAPGGTCTTPVVSSST